VVRAAAVGVPRLLKAATESGLIASALSKLASASSSLPRLCSTIPRLLKAS
jgi:hypothetical protein